MRDILESLRYSAARKSQFDADKELLERAAKEIKRLRGNSIGRVKPYDAIANDGQCSELANACEQDEGA